MTSVYIISLSSSRDCSYTEQTSHTSEASQSGQPPAVKHQLTASSQEEFDVSLGNGSFLDKDTHSDRVAQVDIYEANRNKSPFQGHDKTCSHRLEDVDVSFCDNTFADIEETISSMSPRNHPIARFPSISIQDVGLVFVGFVLHLFPQGLGNSYGVVYTHLKEMDGYSDYQMSWIGSLMAGMLGVGAILGSYLIEGVGWRLTSVVGGLFLTLGMVLSAMVTNLYLLYLCLGVMPGIGAALCQLAAIVCISHHFGKGLPLALCFMATGGAVGMLAFPILWSLVLENFGWRRALLIIGAIALNSVWCSLLLQPDPSLPKKKAISASQRSRCLPDRVILKQRPLFVLFLLSAVFSGVSLFIYGSYIPEHAITAVPDVTSTEIAILVSAIGGGSFFGRILFGSLSMTSPRAPLILFTTALGLCGVSDILVPICRSYISLMLNSTLHGLFLGGWTTIISLVTVSLYGAEKLSLTLGLIFLCQGLGCVAGPPLANMLVQMTMSTEVLFYFAGCGFLLSVLFMLPLFTVKAYTSNHMTKDIKEGETTGETNLAFVEGG
ncbi:monocarboxylate transporter 3-like isoform X1 [Haliotis rufescens]|uniref:monocarboxylate transporter 3-like isoform X1 n=1 Tax=Haliotis rufescens TaxID=6454 RepID=UPI00201F923B|nr:monocarboxylate transporter 3-like isoform X1 [Haliotis rufescens]